jgi:GNAT superfamily N-acetyltransferase
MSESNTPSLQLPIQLRHEFRIVSEKNEEIATLTVERMHGVLWLTNLWTHHEHRRKGYATQLMQAAIDTFGKEELWLNVYPFTNRPLDGEALREWYMRFKFISTLAPGIMRRNAHY